MTVLLLFGMIKERGGGMMKRMIPLDKQSKKNKKAYYAGQRGSWHEVNPVTRIVPGGKVYQRAKEKKSLRQNYDESDR